MTEETEDKPKFGMGWPQAQSRRPSTITDHLRRVPLRTRVLPETIDFLAKDEDGMGKAVDKLVRLRKRKSVDHIPYCR